MPGSTYKALDTAGDPSELEQFESAAKSGSPFEEMVGLALPATGLRNGALAHMTEDWLDINSKQLKIDVPYKQECTMGSGTDGGRGGDTTQTGVPCATCKNRVIGERSKWLPKRLPDGGDCWVPKSEAGTKGRVLPVPNDDAARVIISWFNTHDRVGTQGAVRGAVKRVAKRAGIFVEAEHEDENDWPCPHDLRDTYGHQLAMNDFNRHEIKAAMGHSRVEQADDYIDLSGREVKKAFEKNWSDE
jgi:hypothetical protein